MRIEILVEETSMKVLLEGLIPRLCNNEMWKLDENVFIRAFEGKSHLRKELPKKAKVYANFHEPVFMLVLHDQDSNDCKELKSKLLDAISQTGLQTFKVRIVCRELECWYLGDLHAVECARPETKATHYAEKAKFRTPEKLNGKDEIKKWVQPYGAIEFAQDIAQHLDIDNNRARSFNHTVSVLRSIMV